MFATFDLEAEPQQVTPVLREVGASFAIDSGTLTSWVKTPARRHEKELPLLNAIVKFSDAELP